MAQGFEPPPPRADDTVAGSSDPLQRQILRDQLDRVAEEKRRALEDPGPTWREWFFQSAARWWIGLAFLIVDSWIVVTCIDAGVPLVAVPSVGAALYLEFLAFRYLWYVPSDGPRRRRPFHPSWSRPVRFGRWTPEGIAARANPSSIAKDEG
ncbi:MAG: hypothetical protein ACREDE_06880, partial [Thermoplasmata archaeon]